MRPYAEVKANSSDPANGVTQVKVITGILTPIPPKSNALIKNPSEHVLTPMQAKRSFAFYAATVGVNNIGSVYRGLSRVLRFLAQFVL